MNIVCYLYRLSHLDWSLWVAVSYDLGVTFSISRETMNKERYVTVLNQKLLSFIGNDNQHWYQHDGAPSHFSILARQWLDQHFPQRWIGRRGPKEWPPRSPGLTILDFWLWSYIKDRVYAIHNNYTTLNELEEAISHELTNINQEVIRKCYSSFRKRCNLCLEQDGEHFEQLLWNCLYCCFISFRDRDLRIAHLWIYFVKLFARVAINHLAKPYTFWYHIFSDFE